MLAVLAVLAGGVPTAALAAPDYTWRGEGTAGSGWSSGANWLGGSAPASSSAIGTLYFPSLARSGCLAVVPAEACYTSDNDVSDLSVEQLSFDGEDDYMLSGQSFGLGAGGIVTTNDVGSDGSTTITAPLTLTASQTWDVSSHGIQVGGGLSGGEASLLVQLKQGYLTLGTVPSSNADDELGNVTIEGEPDLGDSFLLTDDLDASDRHSVTMRDLHTNLFDVSTGLLISEASTIELGGSLPVAHAALVNAGGLSLDAESELRLNFGEEQAGTNPGVGYSEIQATGNVELGNATLYLVGNECSNPPAGQVITLISTTGALSGTFNGVPNGSVISSLCGPEPDYRIAYNTSSQPETVTATATGEDGYIGLSGSGGEEPPAKEEPKPPHEESPAKAPAGGGSTVNSGGGSTGLPAISLAVLKASLETQLVPFGKATITAIVKSDGLTTSFKAQEAGSLSVQWYDSAQSAKASTAKKHKVKSVLVASGKASFGGVETKSIKVKLTAVGKKLLKDAKQLHIEARAKFELAGGSGASADRSFWLGR